MSLSCLGPLEKVTFFMGHCVVDVYLVLPELNFFTLNTGILIMVHLVRLRIFSLKMVEYSISLLSLPLNFFFDGQVGWAILAFSFFQNFFVGYLLHD